MNTESMMHILHCLQGTPISNSHCISCASSEPVPHYRLYTDITETRHLSNYPSQHCPASNLIHAFCWGFLTSFSCTCVTSMYASPRRSFLVGGYFWESLSINKLLRTVMRPHRDKFSSSVHSDSQTQKDCGAFAVLCNAVSPEKHSRIQFGQLQCYWFLLIFFFIAAKRVKYSLPSYHLPTNHLRMQNKYSFLAIEEREMSCW